MPKFVRLLAFTAVLAISAVMLVPGAGWAGDATLSWTAPGTNTNGSALTDLSGYKLYYGTSPVTCPGGSTFVTVPSSTMPSPSTNTASSAPRLFASDSAAMFTA